MSDDARKKELLDRIHAKLADLKTDVESLRALFDDEPAGDFPTPTDERAVARLRRGERVNLVPRPGGMWRIDFRNRGGDAFRGTPAASIALALESSESHDEFPRLPVDAEPLTAGERAALVSLKALAAEPECSVRWEKRDTHAQHDFHGPRKSEEFSRRALIEEPVKWLEEQRLSERPEDDNGPNGDNGPEADADHEAAARVFSVQPAQLWRPKASTGHKWTVLGPRSQDDGGASWGEGSTIAEAIETYERKTGDTIPATADRLSAEDAAALDWYANMNASAGPTSIRLARNGSWNGEYFRPGRGAQHKDVGRNAGIAGVVTFFKSEGL